MHTANYLQTESEHVDQVVGWYALYTKHQHEKTVARSLVSRGFEVFLPLYAAARNWKDRIKLLSVPLFPCYVFLTGDLARRLDIISTPGVYAVVSRAGQPVAIPGTEIEAIRQAVGSGARVEPHPFLKCGDWVRVKCGPLAGIRGILVRKKSVYRLVLSVEMLGKAAAVEVDAVLTERLNEKPSKAYDLPRTEAPTRSVIGNQQLTESGLAVSKHVHRQ